MNNSFCHIELATEDTSAAKKFYSQLFNWKLDDIPNPGVHEGKYTIIKAGDGPGGGIFHKPKEAPTGWLPYVLVDSVDQIMNEAQKLGAKICIDKKDVPGMGAFGIFVDPAGAMLGVWENAQK